MALVPLLFAPWGLPLDSSAASGPRLLELEAAAAGPRKAKNPKHQATVDAFWEAQDAGKGAEFLDKELYRPFFLRIVSNKRKVRFFRTAKRNNRKLAIHDKIQRQ